MLSCPAFHLSRLFVRTSPSLSRQFVKSSTVSNQDKSHDDGKTPPVTVKSDSIQGRREDSVANQPPPPLNDKKFIDYDDSFLSRLRRFYRNNEILIMFGVTFVSLHIIWWNLQSHVPIHQRSEMKLYYGLKMKFFPDSFDWSEIAAVQEREREKADRKKMEDVTTPPKAAGDKV